MMEENEKPKRAVKGNVKSYREKLDAYGELGRFFTSPSGKVVLADIQDQVRQPFLNDKDPNPHTALVKEGKASLFKHILDQIENSKRD